MTAKKEASDISALVDMAMAYTRGKAICAAVRLGIADALGNGEKSLDDLAAETASNADSLNRLLRALVCMGIVEEIDPGRFALTSFGDPLRRSAPNSVWASVVFWADLIADAWTYLPECVRAGGNSGAIATMEKEGVRSRWSMEPDATAIFHSVFAEPDPDSLAPLVAACEFKERDIVADLGGAGGSLLAAILTAHPEIRGILVDRKEATELAGQRLSATGLSGRCQYVAVDLLEDVPRGANTYVLKSVLHGYDDDAAGKVLLNCRNAMVPTNRLLVIEAVLPTKICVGDPAVEKMLISDLNMLVATGGHERNAAEWESLLSSTGFEPLRFVAVPGTTSTIIEAAPCE